MGEVINFRAEVFETVLKPLILENYEQRRLGLLPDEWFWADKLAVSWKMYVGTEN